MWFPKLANMVCRYAKKLEHDLFLIVFLYVAVGGAWWLTPTNLPPRGMRSSTLLRGLINFRNKYVSSLWLMWIHGLYALSPFRNLLASSVPCIALSHIESWCKVRWCIQIHDMIRSVIHKPHYIFLQNSHHTYLLRHFHSLSEIHCHATSTISWLDLHVIHAFAWSRRRMLVGTCPYYCYMTC